MDISSADWEGLRTGAVCRIWAQAARVFSIKVSDLERKSATYPRWSRFGTDLESCPRTRPIISLLNREKPSPLSLPDIRFCSVMALPTQRTSAAALLFG